MTESFDGTQEAIYFFPAGGEFDGMAIAEFPDDVTAEGSPGAFSTGPRETLPNFRLVRC